MNYSLIERLAAYGRLAGRARKWKKAAAVLVGLAVVTVMTPQIAGAGSVAVDYAQCANGTGTSRACPDGWINGILQASNSHYHEDEVTPQRLTADVPTAGNHSITLRYQVKKDTTHAYDSLATWNLTQNVLVKGNRCDGLTAGKCAGALTMDPAVTNIPDDPASDSGSAAAGGNGDQDYDSHMIGTDNGHRQFELYGDNSPAFLAFDNPPYVHTMSGSDEYASIKINFSVAQAGKVQLLFGGHIAAPTGLRGWGTGFGASSINGGPYHIKWDKFDSESIGRRDNQIMGSSILPLESVVNTTASAGGTIGTSVTDSATIVGASNPTGNITFKLYGPVTGANPTATCIDPAPNANPPVAGNLVFTDVQPVASSGATSASYTPTAVGTYYWVASYSGDGANAPSTGACGDSNESVTITKASPSIATTAVTPVTIGTAVSDRATLTGGTSDISGNITFSLYGPSASASCTNPDPNATPPVVGNRVFTETVAVGPLTNPTAVGAVSSTYTPTTAGSYYWVASYGGDAKNNTATGTCGDTGETSVVNPGTSAISTAQTLLPNDSATLTGLTATAGGTVTFKLFAPGNATCSEVSPAAASYTQAVNVSGPNTYSTTNTTVNATTVGTWRWLVVYSGDTNNTSSTSACGVENFTITNG